MLTQSLKLLSRQKSPEVPCLLPKDSRKGCLFLKIGLQFSKIFKLVPGVADCGQSWCILVCWEGGAVCCSCWSWRTADRWRPGCCSSASHFSPLGNVLPLPLLLLLLHPDLLVPGLVTLLHNLSHQLALRMRKPQCVAWGGRLSTEGCYSLLLLLRAGPATFAAACISTSWGALLLFRQFFYALGKSFRFAWSFLAVLFDFLDFLNESKSHKFLVVPIVT